MAAHSAPAGQVTAEAPVPYDLDRLGISRLQRRARNSRGLTALYDQRQDLRGVSPVADFVVEAVRWSA